MLKSCSVAFLSLVSLILSGPALAEYPEQPITIIVPHNAGGAGDRGVRSWQPFMEKCLGGTLVPVMRPGGGSAVGIVESATSAPDGYTIGSLPMPNLVSQRIASELSYTIDGFEYIGSFIGTNSTFAVLRNSPLQTLDNFISSRARVHSQ